MSDEEELEKRIGLMCDAYHIPFYSLPVLPIEKKRKQNNTITKKLNYFNNNNNNNSNNIDNLVDNAIQTVGNYNHPNNTNDNKLNINININIYRANTSNNSYYNFGNNKNFSETIINELFDDKIPKRDKAIRPFIKNKKNNNNNKSELNFYKRNSIPYRREEKLKNFFRKRYTIEKCNITSEQLLIPDLINDSNLLIINQITKLNVYKIDFFQLNYEQYEQINDFNTNILLQNVTFLTNNDITTTDLMQAYETDKPIILFFYEESQIELEETTQIINDQVKIENLLFQTESIFELNKADCEINLKLNNYQENKIENLEEETKILIKNDSKSLKEKALFKMEPTIEFNFVNHEIIKEFLHNSSMDLKYYQENVIKNEDEEEIGILIINNETENLLSKIESKVVMNKANHEIVKEYIDNYKNYCENEIKNEEEEEEIIIIKQLLTENVSFQTELELINKVNEEIIKEYYFDSNLNFSKQDFIKLEQLEEIKLINNDNEMTLLESNEEPVIELCFINLNYSPNKIMNCYQINYLKDEYHEEEEDLILSLINNEIDYLEAKCLIAKNIKMKIAIEYLIHIYDDMDKEINNNNDYSSKQSSLQFLIKQKKKYKFNNINITSLSLISLFRLYFFVFINLLLLHIHIYTVRDFHSNVFISVFFK
jgi:hypothetical protein